MLVAVFCSTIGAATDLESEGLRRVFVNGCYWCVGLEDEIPVRSEVDPVREYRPSPFGGGRFREGVRPSDHALPPTYIETHTSDRERDAGE